MSMHRVLRLIFYLLVSLAGTFVLTIGLYDLFVFQQYRPDIDKLVARAEPSEKSPPEALKRVLNTAYGRDLGVHVATQVLLELDAVPVQGGKLGWHTINVLWWCLTEVHLSNAEQMALFLSLSNMGNNIRGFAHSAPSIVGVPLANVSLAQAAQLVTVGKAPSSYLASPELLRRSAERLLARTENAF